MTDFNALLALAAKAGNNATPKSDFFLVIEGEVFDEEMGVKREIKLCFQGIESIKEQVVSGDSDNAREKAYANAMKQQLLTELKENLEPGEYISLPGLKVKGYRRMMVNTDTPIGTFNFGIKKE